MGIDAAARLFFLIFAGAAAVQDLRNLSISLRTFLIFGLLGAVLCICRRSLEPGALLQGFLPGLTLLVLSRLSGGSLGTGDALYFLTAAFYLELWQLFLLFAGGLLLCSGAALCMLAAGFLRGRDMRRKRIPFVVCLLPPALLLCLT